MKTPSVEFLKSVLGEDGAEALRKANQRVPTLGDVLVPRAIVGWLTTAVRVGYEGEIPGLDNSYITLAKSEAGFTGAMTLGDDVHSFENTDLLHVAAAVSIALGLKDVAINPLVKSTDISKLGRSIDMLVKARIVTESLEKFALQPMKMTQHGAFHVMHTPGTAQPYSVHESASGKAVQSGIGDLKSAQTIAGWHARKMAKQELPGKAAAPKAPKEPEAPTPADPTAPVTNKVKSPLAKARDLHIKKSQAEHACPECGIKQFRGEKFNGCMCFRALAKSVTTKVHGDHYVLSLGRSQWDDETVQTLISAFGG